MKNILTFRLYILGQPHQIGSNSAEIVTLAEHGTARRLSRVAVNKDDTACLIDRIGELREFMISGYPSFDENALKDLGGKLFDLVIQGSVKELLQSASGVAGNHRLPLELIVEDQTVAGWPWEYLYDTNKRRYLCQEYYPISRSIFNSRSIDPPSHRPGLIRILFVLGVAPNDPQANAQEELARHEEVLSARIKKNEIALKVIDAASVNSIMHALAADDFDIVHFFGHADFDHGNQESLLRFPSGQSWYANDLANFLIERRIRLVFLNACETGVGSRVHDLARSALAAAILDRGVPAVIATQFEMPDAGAHQCSALIYGSLAKGQAVFQAMREGRNALKYAQGKTKHPDWGIPVLYTNHPDLVIFPGRS